MELFLNSLWLVLAAAAVLGLLRKRKAGCDRKTLLLGLGALFCAAAVLFPAISITDDLHFDALVVEDSSPTKRLVNAITQATTLVDLAWFGLLAWFFLAVSRKRSWRAAEIAFFSYRNPLWVHSPSGRAPPPKAAA